MSATPPPAGPAGAFGEPGLPHFRAHGRRTVQLSVTLRGEKTGWERPATVRDVHLAGAGVETDEVLVPGERVSVAFAAPTLWDPLVLSAIVVWAHPLLPTKDLDLLGRPRLASRAGLAFDHATPDAVYAMFEMLVAIGFE